MVIIVGTDAQAIVSTTFIGFARGGGDHCGGSRRVGRSQAEFREALTHGFEL